MQLSIILIHYHTPDLLTAAVEALAADLAVSGLDGEIIVVDNGSRPQDRDAWHALPAEILAAGGNLGYAGGLNLGAARTRGDVLVAMNPDVRVLPGCLGALTDALRAGAAAAGPRFYWDEGRRFLLPPTQRRTHLEELWQVMANRSPSWARLARRRWRRHARRYWLAEAPLPGFELSGAMLAIRRQVWETVGPFDEGYRLYFEETDWLERLRRAGGVSQHVPAAQAVHLYAQSAGREARSQEWFEASARRFRQRQYGKLMSRLLEALDRGPMPPPASESEVPAAGEGDWLEVSPSPTGMPAAGLPPGPRGSTREPLPPDIWRRLAPGPYYLRRVSADGREIACGRLDKDPQPP